MAAVGDPLVLVADRDPAMREGLRHLLAGLAPRLATADSRQALRDLMASGTVVLIIGDLAVPHADLLALLPQAAADAAAAGRIMPELVVLSDELDAEAAAAVLAVGASHVLPRDSVPSVIRAVVARGLAVAHLRWDAMEARATQRRMIMDSLAAATENIGLVGALEAVLRAARVLLDPLRGALWLAGRDGNMAVVTTNAEEPLTIGHEAVARSVWERSEPAAGISGNVCFEAFPVLLEARCEGALCLEYEGEGPLPDDVERAETMALLAGHAAGAIRRERLFSDLRSSSVKIQSLFEVGLAMASETSLQRLFEVIVDSASRICGAERCSLMVLERRTGVLRMRAARGIPAEVVRTAQVAVGDGIAGSVAASGEPLFIADIESDRRFGRQNAEQYRNASLVCVPIRLGDGVAGVLSVTNKTDSSSFTANDLNLMTLLASQAAVAIDNAERYQDLSEKAITDGLTGVYLRRYFDECLAKATETASAGTRGFSLLMVDIDHFKAVNDTYGHPVGDIVLREVAARIRAAVRDDDLVARYGGEEFAVILALPEAVKARQVAERVRATVSAAPIDGGGQAISVTVSIGLAVYEQGLDEPGMMVTVADAALYRAKASGRNRVVAANLED